MNKKAKYLLTVAAAVLIIAAVILAVKVRGSAPVKSGLIIQRDGNTFVIAWEELDQSEFSGEIINGKREISSHTYRGTELCELLDSKGIRINENTKITVASEDNYSAELTGAEVTTAGKVYVAVMCDDERIKSIDGEQGGQLVVYGDPNAKRQVRYLKTITIE